MLSAHGAFLLVELPPLLSPDIGTMFWTVVTFAVLLFVLAKFAWRPLLDALEKRERAIQDSLDGAATLKADAEKMLEEYRAKIDAAHGEVQGIVDEGRRRAESMRDDIVGKARSEAKEAIDRATREIEVARDDALRDIRREAVDLSVSLASKVIERTLQPADHEKFIRETMKDLKIEP
jgi:F-type H+-transporting ATPase subunit b